MPISVTSMPGCALHEPTPRRHPNIYDRSAYQRSGDSPFKAENDYNTCFVPSQRIWLRGTAELCEPWGQPRKAPQDTFSDRPAWPLRRLLGLLTTAGLVYNSCHFQ